MKLYITMEHVLAQGRNLGVPYELLTFSLAQNKQKEGANLMRHYTTTGSAPALDRNLGVPGEVLNSRLASLHSRFLRVQLDHSPHRHRQPLTTGTGVPAELKVSRLGSLRQNPWEKLLLYHPPFLPWE